MKDITDLTLMDQLDELVAKFYKILESWKIRRALVNIRREFAKAGFTLDHYPDSQIKEALTSWNDDITAVTLSAKTIYRALKQLAPEGVANECSRMMKVMFER